ncbi:hypothetical protein BK122_03080 [Paenibacillus pabuli]|nr:hypothetical protein BK122_03080 [Paenibacillus pabuli]
MGRGGQITRDDSGGLNMNFQELLMKLTLLTDQIVDRLSEVTYEELESFTGERELLVQQLLVLQEKPTEEEKEQIVSILNYDSLIKSRMEFFKNEASDFLEKQGAIKAQQVAYQTNYIPDSLFIDDRK